VGNRNREVCSNRGLEFPGTTVFLARVSLCARKEPLNGCWKYRVQEEKRTTETRAKSTQIVDQNKVHA